MPIEPRMISFRCWYCNRQFVKPEAQVGSRFVCGCKHTLKVPRRSGGRSRVRTPLDWLVEITVYGGGGALLGFGLGAVIASRMIYFRRTGYILAACTLVGFLFGTLGGEWGVNWIGRLIREREQR